MSANLINDDCLCELKRMSDKSIQLTITSPPYFNARKYSCYDSYKNYLDEMREIFGQIHRVTDEGRFLVVNTSPSIQARENRSKQSKRYGIPFDLHCVLGEIGWDFVDDIIWIKPNGAAKNRNGGFYRHRKPLAYKPNIVTEYVMVYRKRGDKLIDWDIGRYGKEIIEQSKVEDNYEKTNVWKINPRKDKEHPAVFPFELAERAVKYYSYTGDIVLDPFMGSGTVGEICKATNRNFIGIEKDAKYFEIAKRRITSNAKSN